MKIEVLFGKPLRTVGSDIHLYMLSAQVDSEFPDLDRLSKSGIGTSAAQELEALKQDLLRLEQGWRPSPSELASAPELQKWGILDTGDPLPKIVGDLLELRGSGPAIANGKRVVTHHVLARDSELTWIRDRRDFYRLDEPPLEPKHQVATGRRRRSTDSFENSRSGRLRFR